MVESNHNTEMVEKEEERNEILKEKIVVIFTKNTPDFKEKSV